MAKGRKEVLSPGEAAGVRARQRRYRQPRPPRVQEVLRRAFRLKARLESSPGLSRGALAKEE